ncbi:hypothetical protein Tco_0767763 [Tanacetum coccineum]
MNLGEIQRIREGPIYSRIPKRQLPGQSREEGMGASTPEALHLLPVSSEDSNKTDLLHLGSGRERREVCSIGWEEKNQARIHALIVTARVSKQRELRYRQKSIIMRAHRPEEPADIRRAKTAKGVIGSPNKKGIVGTTGRPYKLFQSAAKYREMGNATCYGRIERPRTWYGVANHRFIKELKQNDKPMAPKKGGIRPKKERPLAHPDDPPWERVDKLKGLP